MVKRQKFQRSIISANDVGKLAQRGKQLRRNDVKTAKGTAG